MSAPLAAPSSDELASYLARDWAFQVNTGTSESPQWTFVLGLTKFSPKTEATMQDDGDLNSGGYGSEIATELKLAIEADGLAKGDGDGSVQDPGQAHLRAKGEKIGVDNFVHARYWRTDGIDIAKEARFTCKWSDSSEAKDGLFGFSVTLSSRGKPTDIVKPSSSTDNTTPSTPKP